MHIENTSSQSGATSNSPCASLISAAPLEIQDLLRPYPQQDEAPTPDMLLRLISFGLILKFSGQEKCVNLNIKILTKLFTDLRLIKSTNTDNNIPQWDYSKEDISEFREKIHNNLLNILYYKKSETLDEEESALSEIRKLQTQTSTARTPKIRKFENYIEEKISATIEEMYSKRNENLSCWHFPLILFYFIVDKFKFYFKILIKFIFSKICSRYIHRLYFLRTEKENLDACCMSLRYEMVQYIFPDTSSYVRNHLFLHII